MWGIDYQLTRVWEEREGGVPTCVIISPLNFGEAESTHASGPDCRAVSARSGGFGESVRFDAPDSSIPPGSHGYRLPDAYRAIYPASRYPFDDPRAEWAYFRSKSDITRCGQYTVNDPERTDDLISVGVIPYVTYEVISEHYLETDAGYRRPQLVLRFVIGMLVSVQNLDINRNTSVSLSDGGRIVEFLSRAERASATIKTFRQEGGGWTGLDSTRTYECEKGATTVLQIVTYGGLGLTDAYRADVGEWRAAISNLFVGTILVTETAEKTFEQPDLRGAMIRTGFECLVGERVELTYRLEYLNAELEETRVELSRCLGADDLEDLCALLDYMEALHARDANDLAIQTYDDFQLREASVNC